MKSKAPPLFFVLAAFSLPSLAASTEIDNAQLRQQIEQLQRQLQAAEARCPATGSTTADELKDATRPAATPVTVPAVVASPAPPPTQSDPVTSTPGPPPGYKLVKVDPREEPPLPKDDRWRNPDNWDALHRGMDFAEVEQLLGTEHRVQSAKDRVQWTYGKVGANPASRLIFVEDKLAVWERPNF